MFSYIKIHLHGENSELVEMVEMKIILAGVQQIDEVTYQKLQGTAMLVRKNSFMHDSKHTSYRAG